MDYTTLKRPELLQLCRERHIPHYSHKNKKELIALLLKADQPKKLKLTLASAVLRHYYMYPLLTTALFTAATARKEGVHPHPAPLAHE